MIKLSSQTYLLRNLELIDFWKKLDDVTFGQKLNPEFGYTVPFEGSLHNVFAGRRVGNTFTVYRYQPRSSGIRTEILAKGRVIQKDSRIEIKVRFEIPLWSILAFLFLGSLIMLLVWVGKQQKEISVILTAIIVLIYILVIRYNYKSLRKKLEYQFMKFEGYR